MDKPIVSESCAVEGDAKASKTKKPYQAPVVEVFGDFHTLTQVKNGNKADGTGKPATRLSGGNT